MDGFATLFLMVSHAKIGTSAIQTRATAGVAGATYIFCLPGSPGACKDAWDEILLHQLDYRYRPCNFVEIMPRLDEHLRRAKAKARALACRVGLKRVYARLRRAMGALLRAVPTRCRREKDAWARRKRSSLRSRAYSGRLAPLPTLRGFCGTQPGSIPFALSTGTAAGAFRKSMKALAAAVSLAVTPIPALNTT